MIRLSDHPWQGRNGHELPHFDLVSYDGCSGYELAVGFVNRLSRGEETWTPPERTAQRRGQKLRGQK